jgi:hypothetical protein
VAAYPVTAWAAYNGLGETTPAVVEANVAGCTALRVCPGIDGAVGWIDPLGPPVSPSAADVRRIVRIVERGLMPLDAQVASARQRWGTSRLAAVIALEAPDDDAALAGTVAVDPIVEELVLDTVARATQIRGPTYASLDAHGCGLATVASGMRLLAAGLADAVVVGAARALGPIVAAGAGEGAAFLLLERQAEAMVEIFDAATEPPTTATWRSELAYVDADDPVPGLEAPVVASTSPTGQLGVARGPTALAIAATCLERDQAPITGAPLDGDYVWVAGSSASLVLHARLG